MGYGNKISCLGTFNIFQSLRQSCQKRRILPLPFTLKHFDKRSEIWTIPSWFAHKPLFWHQFFCVLFRLWQRCHRWRQILPYLQRFYIQDSEMLVHLAHDFEISRDGLALNRGLLLSPVSCVIAHFNVFKQRRVHSKRRQIDLKLFSSFTMAGVNANVLSSGFESVPHDPNFCVHTGCARDSWYCLQVSTTKWNAMESSMCHRPKESMICRIPAV